MKRLVVVMLDILAILSIGAVWIFIAPQDATADKAGAYEGEFVGVVYGDKGSRAPVALDLTHSGTLVEGELSLGEGLYVNGGFCGAFDLPAFEADIEGRTVYRDPNRLVSSPTFDAGGFDLTIDFEGELSEEGEVMTATAKVDLPWFCGRDPELGGVLYRD